MTQLPNPDIFLRPSYELARWTNATLGNLQSDKAQLREWVSSVCTLFDKVLALDLTNFETTIEADGIRLAGGDDEWRVQLENVESMLRTLNSTSERLLARTLSVRVPDMAPRYLAKKNKVRAHLEEVRASIAMLLGDEERIALYENVLPPVSTSSGGSGSVPFQLD